MSNRDANKSRRWVFTWNNPDVEGGDLVSGREWGPHFRCAVWQCEIGVSGTRHFQGYAEFERSIRLAALKRVLPAAHWEVARGSREQCVAYCEKEETRHEGPWRAGDWGQHQGERNDLLAVKQALDEGAHEREIAADHFKAWCKYYRAFHRYKLISVGERDWRTELVVVCGPPGSGKSMFAESVVATGQRYIHTTGKWWCRYTGEPVVVINDFNGSVMPWTELLQIADRYPHQVETKGGMIPFLARVVILTSNTKPCDWYTPENKDLRALYRRISSYTWLDYEEENSYCVFKYTGIE